MKIQTENCIKVEHQIQMAISLLITRIMDKEVEEEVIIINLAIQEEDYQTEVVDLIWIQIDQQDLNAKSVESLVT